MSPLPSGGCELSTGFLFSHLCGLPVVSACPRCGKQVCGLHVTSAQDGELVCTACAALSSDDGEDDTGADTDTEDASSYYEDYGYYGPGSSWGGRSSKDPHDFTEADGESLRHEHDSSFEEDMGGS